MFVFSVIIHFYIVSINFQKEAIMENIKKLEVCTNLEELISVITEIRRLPKLAAPAITQEGLNGTSVFLVMGDNAFVEEDETVCKIYGKYSVRVPEDWGIMPGPTTLVYFDKEGNCWKACHALTIEHGLVDGMEYYHAVINGISFKRRKNPYPLTGNCFLVNNDVSVNNTLDLRRA